MSDSNSVSHCVASGCDRPANRKTLQLCEMHYYRLRRNGSFEKVDRVKPGLLKHAGGYLLAHAPDHPLRRDSSSRVYEHRIIYHAKHGDGPFACNWCGKLVTWDDLHVDHLNDRPDDNQPGNLVASCPPCNQKRGLDKMRTTQRLKSGRRYTAHGKTMCMSEWAAHLGLSRNAIEYRLNAGWRAEDVFSPRKGRSGPLAESRATTL